MPFFIGHFRICLSVLITLLSQAILLRDGVAQPDRPPVRVTVLVEASHDATPADATASDPDSDGETAAAAPPSPEENGAYTVLLGHTADLPVVLRAVGAAGISNDLRRLNQYLQTAAAKDAADIVFFADFSDTDRVVLYVSMPKLGTTLIRNIDAADETLESRYEITAVVIRGILTLMIDGAQIGIHPSELHRPKATETPTEAPGPAPPCPEPPRTTPPERPARLVLESSVGFGWLSSETGAVQSFRGAIRIPIKGMGLFAGYRGTLPVSKEDERLLLELTPHPIEAGFWAAFEKGTVVFRLGASAVFDILKITRAAKVESAPYETDTVSFRFGVSPFFSADWYISPRAFLSFAVAADVMIYQNAFYVEEAGQNRTFLTLWPVAPTARLGFGLAIF